MKNLSIWGTGYATCFIVWMLSLHDWNWAVMGGLVLIINIISIKKEKSE